MRSIKNSNRSILLLCAYLLLSVSGCHFSEGERHNHDSDSNAHEEHEEDHMQGIHLTKEQIKTMNITFGQFSQIKINDFISATGTLGLPPNAYSSVSAKASGIIKGSINFVEGNYVKKGQRIADLENPEFIEKQQKYLEVAAELTFLKLDLERQNTLVQAKAGVEKNLQKLQSEVQMKTATLKGIAKQLSYWGIQPADLTPDNITDRIVLVSPMSGYITSIKIHNGMYVNPQEELMEIVSENHLHLELDVFEKDIAHVTEGQPISYTVPALGDAMYEGEVHIIGKEFNTENKTVRVHGHLETERPRFIKDLFVEAKIWLNDQTVQALPEKAVIKDGASSYIYAANEQETKEELTFERIRVLPGTSDKGFTAIKLVDEIPAGMQIVTEGAYYVYAQSKVGVLEHEH